jgi:translation initiation factor IF-3
LRIIKYSKTKIYILGKRNNRNQKRSNDNDYVINERIRTEEVRVVEGLDIGIYTKEEALAEARSLGLDLVLISPKANPPVCKVVDFKKFLYEEKKKKKDLERNQVKVVVKEQQFTPNIGENDYNVKKRKIEEFLEKGFKVKVTVFFKGRNIMFKDRGELLLAKLATELSDICVPEDVPKMQSRNKMGFMLKPKKTK